MNDLQRVVEYKRILGNVLVDIDDILDMLADACEDEILFDLENVYVKLEKAKEEV